MKYAYASQVAPAITPSKTSILPIATLELQATADERGSPRLTTQTRKAEASSPWQHFSLRLHPGHQ